MRTDHYRLIRATLPTCQTFFNDIRALLRYMCFPSWDALMDFMMRGLEIGLYDLSVGHVEKKLLQA